MRVYHEAFSLLFLFVAVEGKEENVYQNAATLEGEVIQCSDTHGDTSLSNHLLKSRLSSLAP